MEEETTWVKKREGSSSLSSLLKESEKGARHFGHCSPSFSFSFSFSSVPLLTVEEKKWLFKNKGRRKEEKKEKGRKERKKRKGKEEKKEMKKKRKKRKKEKEERER